MKACDACAKAVALQQVQLTFTLPDRHYSDEEVDELMERFKNLDCSFAAASICSSPVLNIELDFLPDTEQLTSYVNRIKTYFTTSNKS